MGTDKTAVQTVKSADRVLDIFELFAEVREPMALSDIARALDMPTSSAYKLLKNLLSRGYLETDKHEKLFSLGYKLFEIGTRYTQNSTLVEEFKHLAERIVSDINEAVFLSIRDGDKILYIAEKQSTHPVRFVSHVGMKLPLHATAMGKAILSSLESEEIRQIYPTDQLGKLTDATISSLAQLKDELVEIRNKGISFSNGEAVQGVKCVAAPITNSHGKIVAALGLSIPASRMNDQLWQASVDWIQRGAKELGVKLYYQS